jgi:WD40 repeat protein
MTMGIPRQIPKTMPLAIPRITCDFMKDVFASFPQNTTVLLDPQGSEWTSASRPGTYSQQIKHMTIHPVKPFIAMIDMWGNVWIGRTDCPNRVLIRIYDGYLKRDDSANTCTFHSFKRILAIGFTGKVGFYEFSDCLDSMVCRVEVSISSSTEKYWVSEIQSHPFKTIFTVISRFTITSCYNTAKAILLNSKFEVTSESEISSMVSLSARRSPPFCSCFLPDGNSVVIGYSNGEVNLWSVEHKQNNINILIKKLMKVLDDGYRIEKIKVHPLDPSILAIFADCYGFNYVFIVRISPDDSSSQILQRFSGASHFQFDRNYLLIVNHNTITLHRVTSERITELVEYTSQMGSIQSCILDTAKGVIIYSVEKSAAQYYLKL